MAKREDCRICGQRDLQMFLQLGPTPLANRFLAPEQLGTPEPMFPLDVYLCTHCSLVQVSEVVSPEVLFRDYVYVSGTSQTMPRHFSDLAADIHRRFLKTPGSLVVEPASNDGTLLSAFTGLDVRVLGVEPATNIASIARNRGIETINEFFGEDIARRIVASHGHASAVIATNVFAHVDALADFVRGARTLLAPEGVFVFEVSYVLNTIDHLEFDSIYHEHLCFFSITALQTLFQQHDMEIIDVSPQPVHGGSIRVFVQKSGGPHSPTNSVGKFLAEEERRGVRELSLYTAFANRTYKLREELVALITDLRARGKRVVGYGASAKGNTLLNFMGIGVDLVSHIIDKNPLKQGKFTPGMHIPVVSEHHLMNEAPDYALILAWNFVDEVMAQQQAYIRSGGKFIVPIPTPVILPQ